MATLSAETPPSQVVATSAAVAANSSMNTSTQSTDIEQTISNNIASNNLHNNSSNNTISAAADSSDNQPGTPQPHLVINNEETKHSTTAAHNPYANHYMYANAQMASSTVSHPPIYTQQLYSQATDLQPQSQQQQLPSVMPPLQHSSHASYINSYEQFYQQRIQGHEETRSTQQMEFFSNNSSPMGTTNPYLHNANATQNANSNHALDSNATRAATVISSASSPRVVSSTSPSSSSNQMSAGNPNSPNTVVPGAYVCKKCNCACTSEAELQEHITNLHVASPYGSSGYSSSPYIKEEPQPTPNLNNQSQPNATQAANNGEILDLDSQKMLYSPNGGNILQPAQPSNGGDPLHGLHNMQERAGINSWQQQNVEGLPAYINEQQQQQQQLLTDSNSLPNHSPFYTTNKTQSPYHVTNSSNSLHQSLADSQQYMADKSFDSQAACNQQPQMIMSASPAEFPTTTTGIKQDNEQQNLHTANFEPPSSSSATISSAPLGSKAANWKSNEARRPKSYECTSCKKWFTSSGHLKRHYNTTLHKNAVKTSGLPDPANSPLSLHYHPDRDPNAKIGRRGVGQKQRQRQQQPPNPVQPPEPPNSPLNYNGGQMGTALPQYTAATNSPNQNSFQPEQQQQYPQQYMTQVQSTSDPTPQMIIPNNQQQPQNIMNNHPNALAGLSVPATIITQQQMPMPSSTSRGLLKQHSTLTAAKSSEAALHLQQPIMDQQKEAQEFYNLTTVQVKQECLEETQPMEEVHYLHNHYMYNNPKMVGMQMNWLSTPMSPPMSPPEVMQRVVMAHQPHHNTDLEQMHYFPQEQQHNYNPVNTEYHYNSIMQPHSTPTHLATIMSQLQLQQPVEAQDPSMHLQIISPYPHNTMEQLPCISTRSAINNMQPLPPAITIPTTNMLHMQRYHNLQQMPQQHMELQQPVNMRDTINTNIPSHLTIPIHNMPSYHQLPPTVSARQPVDHPLTYQPTITGSFHEIQPRNKYPVTSTISETAEGLYDPPYIKTSCDQVSPREAMTFPTKLSATSPTFDVQAKYNKENQQQQHQQLQTPIDQIDDQINLSPASSSSPHQTTKSKKIRKTTAKVKRAKSSKVDKSITCKRCFKVFSDTCYLTQHHQSTHKGEYKFKCESCGKKYIDETVYNTHCQKHENKDKTFKCNQCSLQYWHKTDLTRHIDNVHKKIKKNICNICEKDFGRKDHLKKHMASHNRHRVGTKSRVVSSISRQTNSLDAKETKDILFIKNKKSKISLPIIFNTSTTCSNLPPSPATSDLAIATTVTNSEGGSFAITLLN